MDPSQSVNLSTDSNGSVSGRFAVLQMYHITGGVFLSRSQVFRLFLSCLLDPFAHDVHDTQTDTPYGEFQNMFGILTLIGADRSPDQFGQCLFHKSYSFIAHIGQLHCTYMRTYIHTYFFSNVEDDVYFQSISLNGL